MIFANFPYILYLFRRFKKFGLEVLKGDVNIKGEKIESTEGLSLTDVYLPLPSYENNYPDNEGIF